MAGHTNGKLQDLKDILAEVSDLSHAALLLEWDQETYMPPGGVQSRSEQLSTLLRLSHVRFTSGEVGGLLDSLEGKVDGDFDSDDASLVRVTRRDYEEARKLSPDLIAEVARAGSTARPVWEKARHDENYTLFAPYLEKNVELNRRIADALGYKERPYDALLNRTEPGMKTSELEAIFAELKEAIVPLVADIGRHADAVDDRVLRREFDTDLQVSYALEVVKRLGYDLERGRQDISTHPFSSGFGPDDVRITTRVSREFFNECLFGSIHESGHAMYEQGMGRDIARTPLYGGASPGVHESQSRLWENLVGRGRAFWRYFYPSLQAVFHESLHNVDEETFYRAVNRSYPSLIRVEADEVTYNMHVLLRFELENEMLEGKLKVMDLPEAWNARVKSYLGVDVPNDRQGALQDIHWSFVSFGIFPGYTIGNLIGAQLMEKVRADIPDLDSQIERGEFGALLGWLRKNVHRHGRKFTPNELMERATGKPLTAMPWIAYVRKKFGALYGLQTAAHN
ncbi:MAG: carboxypeptidase [Chloroflexi bacterium 13_1_40CM_4_65_16]|nr:MAG: carboxypeptidase [Chloroflexi bacterium 13_1_40CM_66_19]OLC49623.1 MAG: carboxypeptidase [Chloroflexi bacterium 13_1_40CM_4_65_16]OLD53809.1 MAG: carboxypeptidase [Actinobacteria bacterium 13_1_40CM_2_66_13]OLE73025.1 MAG: carboxypeptidase [Actinobacteria bacterium 13_1_20CM_2_66_18]TMF40681.1 MAG: carboxypeptidase M32 [Chloroflexota bacterium]